MNYCRRELSCDGRNAAGMDAKFLPSERCGWQAYQAADLLASNPHRRSLACRPSRSQLRRRLRNYHAAFQQERTQLVDHG